MILRNYYTNIVCTITIISDYKHRATLYVGTRVRQLVGGFFFSSFVVIVLFLIFVFFFIIPNIYAAAAGYLGLYIRRHIVTHTRARAHALVRTRTIGRILTHQHHRPPPSAIAIRSLSFFPGFFFFSLIPFSPARFCSPPPFRARPSLRRSWSSVTGTPLAPQYRRDKHTAAVAAAAARCPHAQANTRLIFIPFRLPLPKRTTHHVVLARLRRQAFVGLQVCHQSGDRRTRRQRLGQVRWIRREYKSCNVRVCAHAALGWRGRGRQFVVFAIWSLPLRDGTTDTRPRKLSAHQPALLADIVRPETRPLGKSNSRPYQLVGWIRLIRFQWSF